MSEPSKSLPPVHGDPLLVDHLEGNKRWLARYRKAVSNGAVAHEDPAASSTTSNGDQPSRPLPEASAD